MALSSDINGAARSHKKNQLLSRMINLQVPATVSWDKNYFQNSKTIKILHMHIQKK